jgi:hypothetical protein
MVVELEVAQMVAVLVVALTLFLEAALEVASI